MIESQPMLTIWRRHTERCPHKGKGRDYLKCSCPIWADGYVNGKRTLRRSLGSSDMARARKKAVALESPDAIVCKPMAEAISAYLVNCQHLNENTVRKYRNRLQNKLLPFCEKEHVDLVSELGVEPLDKFRATRKLAVTTSARELETLRQFLAFCLDRRWTTENSALKIKPPRNARPAPVVPYTAAEITKIVTAAGTIGKGDYERLRARAAVLLLRYAALRISDVAILERRRLQKNALLLQTKKTGGTISLPLPDDLMAALEALPLPCGADPENSAWFFINGTGSARTAISVMERCLRAVFKAPPHDGHGDPCERRHDVRRSGHLGNIRIDCGTALRQVESGAAG